MIRTPYFQKLITDTYPGVAIEAINGGFEGSWERLIAKQLIIDYNRWVMDAHHLLTPICRPQGGEEISLERGALKAAHLITSSKISECHT